MNKHYNILFEILGIALSGLMLLGCTSETDTQRTEETSTVFELLDSSKTGIAFTNTLAFDNEFNVYKYRNYYNGGGVAIGDIDSDGLPDIYLISNQGQNKLYQNKGNFEFEDITEEANVAGTKPWSTGVSMVDINADGHLDIYVCNSGDLKGENKQNELFINNGNGAFVEKASEYNLDDKGFSTHASFFDYDKDGDLDAYILNNSYQAIGSFDLRRNERPKRDLLGGDKLMENVEGKFVDVSEKAGIYGSVVGFGLGVTVGDVNNDGWEDIYVSNDFFERDYLYINNQDGTFSEELENQINAISGASMGADMADINNDGYNDIFVTEMLPSEYNRLKSVTTFEDWNTYQLKVNSGYYHQFTRNTFQLNNTNNSFSEIGRLSGVEASDWSWGALIFDMDNDGLKDLFIANGVYRDLTDQDYLQYVSNEEVMRSIMVDKTIDYSKLIEIIPSNPQKNHAYKNLGGLDFKKFTQSGLMQESFSNGSAYGDLDNDGDLDLVVNNLNMPSFIYRNTTQENDIKSHYLKFDLHGESKNKHAIGSKIEIQPHNIIVENQPIRGFQSSMDVRANIGLSSDEPVSVKVAWPSGKITEIDNLKVDQIVVLYEKDASRKEEVTTPKENDLFQRADTSYRYRHKENRFVDFDRDRLLHHMCSTEGPRLSYKDINYDGKMDFYIGGSKGNSGTLLLSNTNGFSNKVFPDFEKNQDSEDAASLFFDADNDGDQDLYVCSGGVEFSRLSQSFQDRLYLNDGLGNFELSNQKLPSQNSVHSTSTVKASDFDSDGDLDLFVGERIVPLNYGAPCSGFILQNDGNGNFTDATEEVAKELKGVGMVTDALFHDLDEDGDEDLVVIGEFVGIEIFINDNGSFLKEKENQLANLRGWWNTMEKADLDGDGDIDFVLGNHGLNSRFKASSENPITLFSKDFDGNGFVDPILSFRAKNGKDYPYALRHNLTQQMKNLTKSFPDYESFKDASIKDIFTQGELNSANELMATTLSSIILINEGGLKFKVQELPLEAQFTPIYAIAVNDFDTDGDLDMILGGNLYGVKPEVGRYDASNGIYLENLGQMKFKAHKDGNGFKVNGEIRDFMITGQQLIVARNNDSLITYKF